MFEMVAPKLALGPASVATGRVRFTIGSTQTCREQEADFPTIRKEHPCSPYDHGVADEELCTSLSVSLRLKGTCTHIYSQQDIDGDAYVDL